MSDITGHIPTIVSVIDPALESIKNLVIAMTQDHKLLENKLTYVANDLRILQVFLIGNILGTATLVLLYITKSISLDKLLKKLK